MDVGDASAPQNGHSRVENGVNGGRSVLDQASNTLFPVHVSPDFPTLNQVPPPPPPVAANGNGAALDSTSGQYPPHDPMDLTALKESVDAAIASIQTSAGALNATHDEEDKQAQLRAMYLAGFRAAQSRPSAPPSREDLTAREPETQLDQTVGSLNSVTMLLPLGAGAGMIKVGAASGVAGTSPSSTSTLSTTKLSESSFENRRITRTASSGSAAASPLQSPPSSPSATSGSNPFPRKLMEMLKKEDSSVVAWLPAGDAFIVRDVDRFVADILPRYFRHTKLTSFQRQLNLYGFRRVTKGPDAGAYRHEMFHRDNPDRCLQMKRTKQKGSASPLLRGRVRSNSVTSDTASPLMTPEHSPIMHAFEPAALSQSAPTVLSTSIMGR